MSLIAFRPLKHVHSEVQTTKEAQRMTTLEQDLDRRADLKSRIERLEQELSLINDRIVSEKGYGRHPVGEYDVQVQHNRRLSADLLSRDFPVAQYPHLYKPAVDTAAIKANISPVILEDYMVEGAAKVVVK